MLENKNDMTMLVSPKSPDSRWVALDYSDKIISEGITPNEVMLAAKEIAKDFFLMFVPIKGNTYIF